MRFDERILYTYTYIIITITYCEKLFVYWSYILYNLVHLMWNVWQQITIYSVISITMMIYYSVEGAYILYEHIWINIFWKLNCVYCTVHFNKVINYLIENTCFNNNNVTYINNCAISERQIPY